MNESRLKQLLDACISGEISPEDHVALQDHLKVAPNARESFRERMDLEAGLRTWATETPQSHPDGGTQISGKRWWPIVAAVAASLVVVAVSWRLIDRPETQEPITKNPTNAVIDRIAFVGTFGEQQDCVWDADSKRTPGSRFSTESLSLVSGVAKLRMDSGTHLVLEGPCELEIVDVDTAKLTGGNVFVHVTELSDGFLLQTPDATIVDEGTEYAVSLDDDATEVHVFDGSVFWEPASDDKQVDPERIESGQARRYARSSPHRGARIPFGARSFVREIEANIREQAGDEILAYDGFENLAGRVRRGRSGFGWSEGWNSGRRGRGQIAEIIDAPDDTVFGIQRTGRRLMRLSKGDSIQRPFEKPLSLANGDVYYVSFLLNRTRDGTTTVGDDQYFQLSFFLDQEGRRRRARPSYAVGVTSKDLPFIKNEGAISTSALAIDWGAPHFLVAKFLIAEDAVSTFLRVYQPGDGIDSNEPTAWTVAGNTKSSASNLSNVGLDVGAESKFEIDELKIGTSWHSVTTSEPVVP